MWVENFIESNKYVCGGYRRYSREHACWVVCGCCTRVFIGFRESATWRWLVGWCVSRWGSKKSNVTYRDHFDGCRSEVREQLFVCWGQSRPLYSSTASLGFYITRESVISACVLSLWHEFAPPCPPLTRTRTFNTIIL